jgi:hypothetical protein
MTEKKDKTGIIIFLIAVAIIVYIVSISGKTGTSFFAGGSDNEAVKYIEYAEGCTTAQECVTKAIAMGGSADPGIKCQDNICYAKVIFEVSNQ